MFKTHKKEGPFHNTSNTPLGHKTNMKNNYIYSVGNSLSLYLTRKRFYRKNIVVFFNWDQYLNVNLYITFKQSNRVLIIIIYS